MIYNILVAVIFHLIFFGVKIKDFMNGICFSSQFVINQSTNKIVIKYLLGSHLSNLDSLYYKVHLPYAQCTIMGIMALKI